MTLGPVWRVTGVSHDGEHVLLLTGPQHAAIRAADRALQDGTAWAAVLIGTDDTPGDTPGFESTDPDRTG